MKKQILVKMNKRRDPLWIGFILLLILLGSFKEAAYGNWNLPQRYESENGFNSNVSVSSANPGYSGSGYVTGLVTNGAETKFDRGTNSQTLTKLDIRYANGTGSNITNLAFYVGSNVKVQDLVLPPTGSWSTWATITVVFTHDPSWGSNMIIKSTSNVSVSANIDYVDYYYDDGQGFPAVATPTFNPTAGTYTSAQSVTISTTTSGATIYYTQDGSTPTTSSTVYSGAISVGSTKTIKAIAAKVDMTNSTLASATYTINIPPPAPGAFTQAAPASGATSVSTSPTFSWAASSNATSYALVVSTNSSYTSPVIDQSGITGTSYTPGTALANSTVYYWRVTATNSTSSRVATNAGLSFTTTAPLPVVVMPTFSPVGGTYTSVQSVTISTTTTGATIYYTQDGSTPTTSSTVYSGAISVGSTSTIKAIATKSGSTNSSIASATYTINIPPPAPGSFSQSAPSSGATGVARTPAFVWGASANATSYTLVVSANSSFTSPVINQSGITATSYTDASQLSASTVYYWRVTAVNSTSSTVASNSGISFTTTNASSQPTGNITRQIWTGIPGTSVTALTNNANYPNVPTATSLLTSFQTAEYGDSYGQRIKGYIVPSVSGSYQFYISGDDDAELWLSTTEFAANKVKIASYSGWTNSLQWDKYGSQASASITLTAGSYYYIEALHKEDNGGDHLAVGWKTPGSSNIVVIPGSVLSTQPGSPLPAPTAFSQTAPSSGATGASRVPTFTWATSANTASYTLVVSTNSNLSSPLINQAGITGTSYTPTSALNTSTTYYWRVTAVGEGGSTVASNAGISFTTQALPLPGSFTQTSPTSGATSVSVNPAFAWTAALDATSYTLVVSTNSSLTSPVINQTGITGTNYSSPTTLATSTTYYWRVSAVNSSGSTIASNANLSFATSSTANTVYISTSGVDASGRDGSSANPWKTLAYAATRVTAGKTIFINAGTYNETQPTILPAGVNISGAGTSSVTLKAGDLGSGGGKEDFTGSLIQLISPSGGVAPVNADQTLSGFTIDGSNKTLKAGIWIQGRNNVIVHHVNIKDCAQRGAVACYGPGNSPAYYITGLKLYDMTITNSGVDLSDETLGNLCIGHLDGADIYNITINDTEGYGIKFIFNGYYKNTKVHDSYIRVNEVDSKWGEDISIEMWDLGPGNEIYNLDCNTWLSMVNFPGVFATPTSAGENLKIHDIKLVDADLSSVSNKETIECALPGVEIYNSYFQDKGFGIAVWIQAINHITIRNNVFYNSIAHGSFTDAGAVYIDNSGSVPFQNINIYNNVFDNLKTLGTQPLKNIIIKQGGVSNVNIKNNTYLNFDPASYDVYNYVGTNVSFTNNIKFNSGTTYNIGGTVSQSANLIGNPGYKNTGLRSDTYYQPSSSSSFAVDKGVNVGLPFSGTAPDVGRWEFAGAPTAPSAFTQTAPAGSATNVSATPTFTWAVATGASTYALVVSTNSSFTSPVINQSGLSGTSYTASSALVNSTQYFWKVTATNTTGSTVASNAGLSFTTEVAPPATVATPTFSLAAGTYTSAQSVTISTTTSGATIYYTTDGTTPTASSTVYSGAINVGSTQTIKAIGIKSSNTNSAVSAATYTINLPPPAPSTFTQSAPAAGATGVAVNTSFTWAASSNAASYTLVVSTNSSLTSPVINQSGITGTSFSASGLNNSTQYYWRVTAVNATSSTNATNSGLSFTTVAPPPPPVGQPGLTREIWTGITGTTVSALTGNVNYPNSPTSTSIITSFNAQEYGDDYGQRIKGYLAPTVTGSYQFWIAADDQAELWLSTNENPANKVKIASVSGWTNPYQYNKEGSQSSSSITLTAGNFYYIEALHKELNGGDHVTVAWQVPGGSQTIITSTNLVTAPPVQVPPPGTFSLTAPANSATGVSLTPAFSWSAASDAASYTLVVSTSSSYTSPVINQTGITGTSFTPGGGLAGNTLYYWKAIAVNAAGSRDVSAGRSFTTLIPPSPGAFNQTAPASNATSISRNPTFTWGAASNSTTYSIVVSTSSAYTSPIINVNNLTSTSYSPSVQLAAGTKYYWKVTAVNSTAPTNATNAGISFTTGATTGTYYYVATNGVDAVGRGSSSAPFATPSYAATQIAPNQNNTIYINAGTYTLTQPVILPLGVNIEGAGKDQVTLKSSGVALPAGVDGNEQDFRLWAEGSLIQAVSPIYFGPNPRNNHPEYMIAPVDGNHTISGFTIDGNNKSLKAGIWITNRNNIVLHDVNFLNLKQTGAVVSRGDMDYFVELQDGQWVRNVRIYNCNFTNSGSNPGEQEGALKIGAIDGGEVYNINITDQNGQGIKFAYTGHYRNVKIHDIYTRLAESHPVWGEFMAIELWNVSYGNELYNVDYNTWLSFVNFVGVYDDTPTGTDNLYVHDVRGIDLDGNSDKEAVEVGAPSVTVANSYFQDKGFYMAVWNEGKRNINIFNNIFANVLHTPNFGFHNGSGVFVPDATNNIKIYNNIFDRMGNGLQLNGGTQVDVRNNVFIETEGADVENGGSITFTNNLKYHTNPTKVNFVGNTSGANNILGNPGFRNSGNRWDNYYKPSSNSLVVNRGVNVGFPFSGSAPDIGRWEFGLNAREATDEVVMDTDAISTYPNPTTGIVKITAKPEIKILGVEVMNTQGAILSKKSANELRSGEIDLSDYNSDVYILRVKHQSGLIIKKVVLVK